MTNYDKAWNKFIVDFDLGEINPRQYFNIMDKFENTSYCKIARFKDDWVDFVKSIYNAMPNFLKAIILKMEGK